MKIRLFNIGIAAGLLWVVIAATGTWATAQDGGDIAEVRGAEASVGRGSAASWAADLPAVSDGRHLWLWADDTDPLDDERRLTALYHADATHRPPDGPAWEAVTKLTGRLAPRGAAADGDNLWMIFDDGRVSIVSLTAGAMEDQWFYSQHTVKSLPASTTVRAGLAADGKLWVLARVETGQALADLDRGQAPVKETPPHDADADGEVLNLLLGLPRELPIDSEDPLAADPTDAPTPESAEDNDTPERDAGTDARDTEETQGGATGEASVDEHAAAVATDIEQAEDVARETLETAIDDNDAESEPLPDAPADRLLVLDRGSWRVVPLPDGWLSNRPTQLIAPRDGQTAPALLVQGAKANASLDATLYRPTANESVSDAPADSADRPLIRPASPRWTATPLRLPTTGSISALRLKQQLLITQHAPTPAGFAAQVWAVRGDQLIAIGQATLDESTRTPAHGLWTTVLFGDAVGILADQRNVADAVLKRSAEKPITLPAPGPTITALDLRGNPVLAPHRMDVDPEQPIAEAADYIILLGVVITSTVLLFTFWRRDPTANELRLPADLVIADLLRRGLAGAIDLTPGVLVATRGFGLPWEEVYERWPGRGLGATWQLMLPGLTAIGILVVHTMVLEAATGRSLGKWATGLRVTTLTGGRPRLWQVLVRCPLKAFDLIAYLLLILPVISPYRQRLGDMVASTVVVAKAPAPEVDAPDDRDGEGGER